MDINQLGIAGKCNMKLIMEGQAALQRMRENSEHPMQTNEELLLKILEDNKDTEIGKKYDFANIHSVKEYQEKVPVSVYDNYAEAIMRMTEKGEDNLITVYPVHHYSKTSGTMGTPKRIPLSDLSAGLFSDYATKLPWALAAEKEGLDWVDHKMFALDESSAEEATLPCGASYGAISQKNLRMLREILPLIRTSPDEAIFPKNGTDTRYLHARFGLMTDDVRTITTTFYSFLLEQLRYIEKNWEMLVDDIENGTIDISVKMNEEDRAALESKLQPMPERAAELREIFSEGFETPFLPKVWPNLSFIGGIGTGGFKNYAEKIHERYAGDQVDDLKLGICSSEAVYTAPFDLNCEDTVVIPDVVFYEFLPLDADGDLSKIVTLDGLEEGKDYEIILTNLSGLYRYRIRDAVRCTGYFKNAPTLQFLYRMDQTVSIMGEKTTEAALRMAAEKTAKELNFDLVDFSVFPDLDARPVRYQYFLEIARKDHELRPKEIRFVLEKNLALANPSMGQKVKAGTCGDTRVNFLEPETYMLYRDLMISKGTAATQVKPVHVISNEIQRKFFFSLTDYSCEIVR